MTDLYISDSVIYIGADDKTLDLFESQYPIPNGVSYNSYLILDEKIAVMDTVDERAGEVWFENLKRELHGKKPDYLVVSHMEPDHAANILRFAEVFPDAVIVGNAKTFPMIEQFFHLDLKERKMIVKEKDVLSLGQHRLQFFMAPMVHWPEVMVTYEQTEKILFSADAFGKFGALDTREDWDEEAARYYLNIVGKYGVQAQALLKKASALDIQMICPLHGPVLKENLAHYIGLYQTWSSYRSEVSGVLVAYASIYGHTREAAEQMAELLCTRGQAAQLLDLSRTDLSFAVRKAFYFDRMVLAAPTYDGGLFPRMEEFLMRLKAKHYQKRRVGIIENGSWAPLSGKVMMGHLTSMKEIQIAEPVVTLRSTICDDSRQKMITLAEDLSRPEFDK